MTKIIIAAELQGPLNEAAFLRMGRLGQTRQRPGYTVTVDGTVEAIRDSLDDAEDFAVYYRDEVLLGDATIILS
jgi:hypothetical protein